MDFFCLIGGGIRAGYASSRLLRSVRPGLRARVAGRVVLALTASRYYALQGVAPGTPLARAARRLRLQRSFRIGANSWFVIRGRAANGVLKVQHGVVQEVGIADRRLTDSRAHTRRFLASFS